MQVVTIMIMSLSYVKNSYKFRTPANLFRCCLLIYALEEKMEVEQTKYQGMDRKRLINIIEQQRLELIQKEAICKEYKKHLE